MGLSWGCRGVVVGLSWGCHGTFVGLSWGAVVRLSWGPPWGCRGAVVWPPLSCRGLVVGLVARDYIIGAVGEGCRGPQIKGGAAMPTERWRPWRQEINMPGGTEVTIFPPRPRPLTYSLILGQSRWSMDCTLAGCSRQQLRRRRCDQSRETQPNERTPTTTTSAHTQRRTAATGRRISIPWPAAPASFKHTCNRGARTQTQTPIGPPASTNRRK